MNDLMKCGAIAGVATMISLATTASFAQDSTVEVAPTVAPYADAAVGWQWQYHGGPKSTETTDRYYVQPQDVYGPVYGTPADVEVITPR
jgi:hypothetical protein